MWGLIGGVIGGLGSLFGGNSQAREIRRAAQKQQEAYAKAQELLERNKNEAVTELELAQLKSDGLLDDAEMAYITEINATEGGVKNLLNDWYAASGDILASEGELMMRDLVQYGIINPTEDINKGTEKAIAAITGDSETAMKLFEPYTTAGKRGIEKRLFLTGDMTEEERTSHLDTYGDIEESPIYKFRQEEASKMLDRSQKARGIMKSGSGLKEELNLTNQLTAEETERQLGEARSVSQLGLQATQAQSNILGNRSSAIAGLEERRGVNLANVNQGGGQALTNVRRGLLNDQLNRQNQHFGNTVNQQNRAGELRANMRRNTLLNKAQNAGQTASNIANAKLGVAGQQSNLITGGANQAANLGIQAATAQNQGMVSGLGMMTTGAGNYAKQQGFNQEYQNYLDQYKQWGQNQNYSLPPMPPSRQN